MLLAGALCAPPAGRRAGGLSRCALPWRRRAFAVRAGGVRPRTVTPCSGPVQTFDMAPLRVAGLAERGRAARGRGPGPRHRCLSRPARPSGGLTSLRRRTHEAEAPAPESARGRNVEQADQAGSPKRRRQDGSRARSQLIRGALARADLGGNRNTRVGALSQMRCSVASRRSAPRKTQARSALPERGARTPVAQLAERSANRAVLLCRSVVLAPQVPWPLHEVARPR